MHLRGGWLWVMLLTVAAMAAPRDETAVVVKVGRVDVPAIHAGDSVSVEIPLAIARGFHVNANPSAGEDYIPLEIVLRDSAGVRVGAVAYPSPTTWRLEGGTEDLLVYEGRVSVRVPLVAARDATAGERVLTGTVEFQACNSQVCFMPDSRPLRVAVRIMPAP